MRFCVGVDSPRTASLCQNEVVADLKHRRPSTDQIIRIGMDTSKHVGAGTRIAPKHTDRPQTIGSEHPNQCISLWF